MKKSVAAANAAALEILPAAKRRLRLPDEDSLADGSSLGSLRRSLVLLSRVPIVEPRFRGVRVAPHFPEALLVLREKLDLADPLRPFPRVELRRDHAAGTAVLAGQRLAFPRMREH